MSTKENIRAFVKSSDLTTVFGLVTDLKSIGEGGNGLVYSGKLLERAVAVKFLCDEGSGKLERFKSEFINVAALENNPFVAKVLFYEEILIGNQKIATIFMHLYDGALEREEDVDTTKVNQLFIFLLNSLDFIHSNGIVHRDIKPQNILISSDAFKLADFGIAKFHPEQFFISPVTKKGERLANYLFSAPEQSISGSTVGPWSDIFAMGQIIQWFVTGSIHRGTSRTSLGPGLEILDKVVDRCLINDVASRFQSCNEIKNFLSSQRALARRPDPWKSIHAFQHVLAKTFPKTGAGFFFTSDHVAIDRFFTNLNTEDFDEPLAWMDGVGSIEIQRKITQLQNNVWLLGNYEISVNRLFGFVHSAGPASIVFLELASMPPFGLHPVSDGQQFDSVGLFDGKTYISVDELHNGYAEIEGQVISLSKQNAEERIRFTRDTIICLSTTAHNAYILENEEYIKETIESLGHGASEINLQEKVSQLVNKIRVNMREDVRKWL